MPAFDQNLPPMADGGAIKLRTVLKRDPVAGGPEPPPTPTVLRDALVPADAGENSRRRRKRTAKNRGGGSRVRSKSRYRFLTFNLPLVLIAVLGLYAISEWMVTRLSTEALQSETRQISQMIAKAVKNDVVAKRRTAIRDVLTGAAANADVRGIEVRGAGGDLLATVGTVGKAGKNALRGSAPISVTVDGATRQVGTVTVAVTNARLVKATDTRRRVVAIIALSLAMVAVVIGLLVQDTTVRVPLKKLNEAIRTREATGRSVPVNWKSTDEPGQVIKAFNELQEREDMYVAALREAQTRIEHRIAERTEELESARGEARAAADSRTAIAAKLSHELRTPLNTIIGFADMIDGKALGPLDKRYREYGQHIGECGRGLLELVDDLLIFSRMDGGGFALQERDLPIATLIGDCVRQVTPAANARQHRITAFDLPQETLRCDDEKMRQVLVKLLTNSIEHTDPGGEIEISCELRRDGLRIHVTDNGPGIPPEEQEQIFHPFTRGEAAEQRDQRGVGLGLALAKSIVDLHGGKMEVISKLGRGTCMTVVLPAERIVGRFAPDAPKPSEEPAKRFAPAVPPIAQMDADAGRKAKPKPSPAPTVIAIDAPSPKRPSRRWSDSQPLIGSGKSPPGRLGSLPVS